MHQDKRNKQNKGKQYMIVTNISKALQNATKLYSDINQFIDNFCTLQKDRTKEDIVRFLTLIGQPNYTPNEIVEYENDNNPLIYVTYANRDNCTITIRAYKDGTISADPNISIAVENDKMIDYNVNTDQLNIY